MSDIVLLDVSDRIATITMNRPEARNALSSALIRELNRTMHVANDRDDVDVIILTGTDPAFSAGLDLKELGDNAGNLGASNPEPKTLSGGQHNPFFFVDKPLIAAVNGACITGAFELALNCDFIVASENAKFGDTHSRVGVMPGWGLTVLLAQAIGVRRAREMSFTGNFMSGAEAFEWGLANHVVAHADLLPTCRQLARDIIGNDQPGVRQIRRTYNEIHRDDAGWDIEARDGKRWQQEMFSKDKVAARRGAIMDRGRKQ
jgi:enoyl-CoA hydratase